MEKKFELGIVLNLDLRWMHYWTDWLLLPFTSLSPSLMAVPFLIKLLLEQIGHE